MAHRTVRLPDRLVDAAAREASQMNRSLAGQIEYWARLGQTLERSPDLSFQRIRAALDGRFDAMRLSAQERDDFDEKFGAELDIPKGAGKIFWDQFDRSKNTDL